MEEKTKIFSSVVLGCISTMTQKYALLLLLVIIAIVFDVVTGLIKAGATGTGLDSGKGTKGFFKKIALLVALFFGFFLDFFIPIMCSQISIELPFDTPFALIICFYICINESISVVENLYAINEDIIPKWLINILRMSKQKIDKVGELDNAQAEISEEK